MLTYHRVIETDDDPYGLAVPPEVFDAHMERLSEDYRVLTADELVALIARRRRIPSRSIVVTFDDGYFDLATHVKPVLERRGVPATAFVSTAEIGTGRERWWDELAHLEGGLPDPARYAAMRAMDAPAREAALDALAESLGSPRPARAKNRSLTVRELAALAESPLVTIGAHTVSHGALAALDPDAQRAEVAGGKAALEAMLGRPVTLFSYPFGGADAVSDVTRAVVAEAGFSAAFTTEFGLAFSWSACLGIPRCSMSALPPAEFSAQLDQWFALGR